MLRTALEPHRTAASLRLVRRRFRRAVTDPLDPAFRLLREAIEKNEVAGAKIF